MKQTKLESIKSQINTLKSKQRELEKKETHKIARAIIKAGYASMPADKIISILSKHKEDIPNGEDKKENKKFFRSFNRE